MADDEEVSDVDSISTTSTVVADSYIIDKILADRKTHQGKQWLVSWAGYDLSECTWEPRSSFNDDFGLKEWRNRKKRGDAPSPARIKEIEVLMNQRILAKLDRSQRRAAKRKRLAAKRQKLSQASRIASHDHDKSSPRKKRRRLVQRASSKIIVIDSDQSEDEDVSAVKWNLVPQSSSNGAATNSYHAAKDDDSDVLPPKKLPEQESFSQSKSVLQSDPHDDDNGILSHPNSPPRTDRDKVDTGILQAKQLSEQGTLSHPHSPEDSDLADLPLESYGPIVAELLTGVSENVTPDLGPMGGTEETIQDGISNISQSGAGANDPYEEASTNPTRTAVSQSAVAISERIPAKTNGSSPSGLVTRTSIFDNSGVARPVADTIGRIIPVVDDVTLVSGRELSVPASSVSKPTDSAISKSKTPAEIGPAESLAQQTIIADTRPVFPTGGPSGEQTQSMDVDSQKLQHTCNAMDVDEDDNDNNVAVKAVETNGQGSTASTDANAQATSAGDRDLGSLSGGITESPRRKTSSHGLFVMDSDDESLDSGEVSEHVSRDSGEMSEDEPSSRDAEPGQSSVHPDLTRAVQQPRVVPTASNPVNGAKPTPKFKPIVMTTNPAKVRSRSRVDRTTANQSKDSLFKNLSTENRYQKYGRESERAPDADSLTFVDLRTGQASNSEPRRRSSPSLTGQPPHSNVPGKPSHPSEAVQDETRLERVFGQENVEDDRNSSASLSTVRSKHQISSPTHAERTNPGWVRQNVECRAWLKHGRCSFENNCRFAHHDCELLEPKESRTCSYWQNSTCQYPAWKCSYQHALRDPLTNEFPDKGQDRRPVLETARQDGVTETNSRKKGVKLKGNRSDVTCRRWLLGTCRSTPAECNFAHDQRDHICPKRKATCKNWLNGECPQSDAFCEFYHCKSNANDGQNFGRPRIFRTCQAWKAGRCPHSEDRCPAYHCFWSTENRKSNDNERHFEDGNHVDTAGLPTVTIVWSNKSEVVVSFLIQEGGIRIPPRSKIAIHSECPSGKYLNLIGRGQQPVNKGVFQRGPKAMDSMQFVNWAAYLSDNDLDAIGTLNEYMVVISTTKATFSATVPTSAQTDPNTTLFFFLLDKDALVLTDVAPEVPIQKSTEDTLLQAWAKFDIGHIFAGHKGKPSKRVVFLMMPPAYEAEIHAVSRYLKKNNVTVFLPHSNAAWNEFMVAHKDPKLEGLPGGCVLWHPKVDNYWQLPEMLSALWRTSINFFRMDMFQPIDDVRATCTRIFPRGYALLVTDDTIVYEPQLALNLVEQFHRSTFNSPSPDRKNRLFFRPNILEFVVELALAATDELNKKAYFRMAELLHDLLHPWARSKTACEDASPFETEPLVVSSDEDTNFALADYASLWREHPTKATYVLVQVFVSWSLLQVEDLRRFGAVVPLRVKHPDHFDSDSEMEDSEPDNYAPRSPATPKTPRPGQSPSRGVSNTATRKRSNQDARIGFWTKKYKHVWFLSAERWLQDQKDPKRERKGSK